LRRLVVTGRAGAQDYRASELRILGLRGSASKALGPRLGIRSIHNALIDMAPGR